MSKDQALDNFSGKPVDPKDLRGQLDFTLRAPIELRTRCGKCRFYKDAAAWGEPCAQLGVLEDDLPCKKFTLNPKKLGMSQNATLELLKLVSEIDPKYFETLAALLHTSRRVIKLGFIPGQTIYLRLFNGDYLSNYVRAIVLSATRTHIVIFGRQNYVGLVLPENLLTKEQWQSKKKDLVARGRLTDPRQKITKKQGKLLVESDAPLIRSLPLDDNGEVIIRRGRGRPPKNRSNVIKLR